MKILKRTKLLLIALLLVAGISSCECHHEEVASFRVGHVLCTDGSIMPFCKYIQTDKEAIGLVFYVNNNPEIPGRGYAVYLNTVPAEAFSSELGEEQGTSTDVGDLEGNANTYQMYSSEKSPLAEAVFAMWKYGQSAYIPSVGQLRLLQEQKDFLNQRIEALGGDILPDDPEECWYWTSTEVDGQATDKAWLFSMHTGTIQETPKTQKHPTRGIITIQ